MTDASEFDRDIDQAGDARLKALFAEDLPPARDAVFQATLMERVARRRFYLDVALISGACTVLGVVLWAVWPAIAPPVTEASQQLAPVAATLTLAAVMVMIGGGQLPAVLRGEHD